MTHTKRAAFDRLRGSNWVGMRVRAATNRLPGGRERLPVASEGYDVGTDGMQVQEDSYESNIADEVYPRLDYTVPHTYAISPINLLLLYIGGFSSVRGHHCDLLCRPGQGTDRLR